jgi:hypothetical protein
MKKFTIFNNKWLIFFAISHVLGWTMAQLQTWYILKEIQKATDLIMNQLHQKD